MIVGCLMSLRLQPVSTVRPLSFLHVFVSFSHQLAKLVSFLIIFCPILRIFFYPIIALQFKNVFKHQGSRVNIIVKVVDIKSWVKIGKKNLDILC